MTLPVMVIKQKKDSRRLSFFCFQKAFFGVSQRRQTPSQKRACPFLSNFFLDNLILFFKNKETPPCQVKSVLLYYVYKVIIGNSNY